MNQVNIICALSGNFSNRTVILKFLIFLSFNFYRLYRPLPAASQQEGSGFDSTGGLGSFCVEFACSPRVFVGSLWVLRLPPTLQRHACGDRLIGSTKVALGVSVCEWLSVCVLPCDELATCPGCTPPLARKILG